MKKSHSTARLDSSRSAIACTPKTFFLGRPVSPSVKAGFSTRESIVVDWVCGNLTWYTQGTGIVLAATILVN